MSTFDEYLTDWEFGEDWRPVVEHLAARVTSWPRGRRNLKTFAWTSPSTSYGQTACWCGRAW
ncbi:hypothetical protein [Streptomyces sp. NPDC057557]|uniref:hypothetical protein n=1 Tax=Streptomyces sp. NPDC057557 TaxID=3346167 RepID=UPI00367DE492